MLNQGNLTEGKLKRKFLYNSMVTDQNLFQISFNSIEIIVKFIIRLKNDMQTDPVPANIFKT